MKLKHSCGKFFYLPYGFISTIIELKESTIAEKWAVRFSTKAEKQYLKLKQSGSRPPINDVIDLLVMELEEEGPERINWPNYGPLSKSTYHPKKGRPTYVACWTVLNHTLKQIEIYYVGTHEGAPY